MKRCLNIDWLEIYCLEDILCPLTAERLNAAGEHVVVRPYGTRVYNEMFTVYDVYGYPMLEVRRAPIATQERGAVMPINACHLRLVNRFCYCKNPVAVLSSFCRKYGVSVERVSRVDICLDFEKFDTGDDPQRFVSRYIKGKYTKINQSNVHAHGTDTWEQRLWNSLSWGSPKSSIGTKLYCKTMELQQVKDKPYIRQAWFESGLVDDPMKLTKKTKDGQQQEVIIWRLEFSVKSPVRNWVQIEVDGNHKKYRSIRNTLAVYETKDSILAIFQSLVEHYFHFKHYQYGKTKYQCPDKALFKFSASEKHYSIMHPSSDIPKSSELQRLRKYLQAYLLNHFDPGVKASAETLLKAIEKEDMARLLANPYSHQELLALQLTIAARIKGKQYDPADKVAEIIEAIKQAPDRLF